MRSVENEECGKCGVEIFFIQFFIEDYLKALKLFPVACRYGWHRWKWIETRKNWLIFSSFDATCSKNPQGIYYG